MSTKELVEPTGTTVKETEIVSGVAAEASLDAGPSSLDSLRAGMSKLPPAKPEPSAAQRASAEAGQDAGVPPADNGAPPPESGKTEEPPAKPQRHTGESALDSFQSGLKKARRDKQKGLQAKQEAADAEPPPAEVPPAKEEKTEGQDKSGEAKPPAETTEEQPVTDEEIQQTINDPAISKRHQKRMVFLANRAKELELKLAAAEKKPETDANAVKVKELEDAHKAAEQELIRYRRRYSLEKEPELQKFDTIATSAEEAILGKLQSAGLSAATIKLIKGMGGFEGFANSSQAFTINVKDETTGEVVEKQITAAALAKKWLGDMNVGDAEYIRAKLAERFNAVDAKKRRTEELAADAEQWFKSRELEQQKQIETQQKHATDYFSSYEKQIGEWAAKQELLKDKPVPPAATPEERKEIEDYNKHNAGVKALMKMAANPTSLSDHVAVVQEAANALLQRRENTRLTKELAALKEKLDKLQKGVSTTGNRGGGSIAKVPPKKEDTSAAGTLSVSAADSLRDAMEKLRENAEG